MSERSSKTRPTPKQCLQRSLETTSVRGVARAIKEPNKCLKFTWITAIGLLFIMCVWSISAEVVAYFTYPVVAELRDEDLRANHAQLADFRICNANPIASSKSGSQPGVESYDQYRDDMVRTYASKLSNAAMSHMASYQGYFQYLGSKNAAFLGHDIDDFVLECIAFARLGMQDEYTAGQCEDIYEIKRVLHHKYFNCYTFHLKANLSIVVSRIKMMVHLDNIQADLDIPDVETDDIFDSASGLVLNLRQAPDLDDYWDEEVIIPQGTFTKLHVSPTVRALMQAPYGSCQSFTGAETPKTCNVRCLQNVTRTTCDCDTPKAHLMLRNDNKNYDPCGKVQSSTNHTKKRVECMINLQDLRDCATCPRPCASYSHRKTISSRSWPSTPQHVINMYTKYVKQLGQAKYNNVYDPIVSRIKADNHAAAEKALKDTDLIQSNFASLELSFSGTILTMVDKQKTSIASFLAKLGGTLNLFSGISMLVFVEVIDLIVKVFLSCVGRKSIGRSVNTEM